MKLLVLEQVDQAKFYNKIHKINTSLRLLHRKNKMLEWIYKLKLLQHSRIYPMKKTNKAENRDEAGLIVSFWKQ